MRSDRIESIKQTAESLCRMLMGQSVEEPDVLRELDRLQAAMAICRVPRSGQQPEPTLGEQFDASHFRYVGRNNQGDQPYVVSRKPLSWKRHSIFHSAGCWEPTTEPAYIIPGDMWKNWNLVVVVPGTQIPIHMDDNLFNDVIRPRTFPQVLKPQPAFNISGQMQGECGKEAPGTAVTRWYCDLECGHAGRHSNKTLGRDQSW